VQLLMTPTSPYARKVRVVARELGRAMDEVAVLPLDDDPRLLDAHPLGRVPVLIVDGESVVDSRVIVRELDVDRRLQPEGVAGRRDRVLEATAEGMLDTAVSVVMERRRPTTEQSPAALDRATAKIVRTLQRLELPLDVTLGSLGVACALAYLDFRLPEILWRENRSDLGDAYANFARRPSFMDTMPPAGA
jgi:glutathione S-transferase